MIEPGISSLTAVRSVTSRVELSSLQVTGDVLADAHGTGVSMLQHMHPTAMGPSSKALPGAPVPMPESDEFAAPAAPGRDDEEEPEEPEEPGEGEEPEAPGEEEPEEPEEPASKWDEQWAFMAPFEGIIPHMYLDSRGYVTAGVGFLLTGVKDAMKLPFEPRGKVVDDFMAVQQQRPGQLAKRYGQYTNTRLQTQHMRAL